MKKITVLLVLMLLCLTCTSFAEGNAYNEPTLLDQSVLAGLDTHYYLYDREFYEAPDTDQPGTVVKLKYNTDLYGDKTYKKYMNVYLPYGYDENGTERYPVIYFFHGRGCDPTTLIGNEYTKNAFDHMISTGVVPPFILVAPTVYYDARHLLSDMEIFPREMREQIMPLVEGTYRTYAETPDEAGFRASRDYRAICGFSMGSGVTWNLFDDMLDVSYYFMPFSGASADLDAIHAAIDNSKIPFFLYLACGGPEDGAFEGCVKVANTIAADTDYFSYGTDREKNNFYFCLSDNVHQDLCSRYYLFNAFRDVLFQ